MTDLKTSSPLPGVEAHPGSGHYGVYDHGAHVWAWQPDGHPHPVLWMSSASAFAEGKPIRGGVPICFPWFGPGFTGDRTPMHGFARLTSWRRDSVDESGGTLEVSYVIDETDSGEQPEFPFPYQARMTVSFSADHLELSLRVQNNDAEPFTIEEALHTYLAVSDVRTVTVDGLDGAAYLDKVLGDTSFDNEQDGPLVLTGRTDRVYAHAGEVTVDDPGYGRRLVISTSGSANVVVWNPWSETAATMADVGEGEWQTLLCVEAANAFNEAVTLLPGEHWTMSQRIEIAEL